MQLGVKQEVRWLACTTFYSLPEIGLLWFETYIKNHHHLLKMKRTEIDACFLYIHGSNRTLEVFACLQVNKPVGIGREQFLSQYYNGSELFADIGLHFSTIGDIFKFNSMYINIQHGRNHVQQRLGIEKVPSVKIERSAQSLMSIREQVAYVISLTEPEITFVISLMAKNPPQDATERCIEQLYPVSKRTETIQLRSEL